MLISIFSKSSIYALILSQTIRAHDLKTNVWTNVYTAYTPKKWNRNLWNKANVKWNNETITKIKVISLTLIAYN